MDHHDELRLLRGACAASRTGAWRFDAVQDSIEWTPLLYDLFAVPRGTPLTLDFGVSFYVGKSQTSILAAVEQCLTQGTPWSLDTECRSATGHTFWARSIGEAIYEGDRIVALQGAFQDITAERNAMLERARAQAELSFVLRTMTDGFFLLDSDWRFSFVNAASEGMLRRGPEQLVGRCIWEEFPEALGTIIEESCRVVRATGVSQAFQTYYEPLETWFHVTVHPAQLGVAVHFRNVTREVREQQDLRLFQTAIDAMNSGAHILQAGPGDMQSWEIVYANAAAAALLGSSRQTPLGRTFGDITRGTECSPNIAQVGTTLAKPELCKFEARRDNSGRPQILDCVAVPLSAKDGLLSHVAILMDDVTEQRRIDEERHRSDRLALIGQMAGGVSHDFNNLLAVILGNVELLELTTDPEEAKMLVSEARAAVMRGKSLNDSLLAFAGKSTLTPQTVDLGTFVQSIAPLLQRAVPSRIKLEMDLENALPPVLIDDAMAESCLLNLVINAREAIEETGTIRISLDATGGSPSSDATPQTWVRLSVMDTGCGIPEHLQSQVFEPFFTTRSLGEGSGLGLSRVRGYLEQIGGFVTLSSSLDQGTTVAMYFAVAPVDTREAKESAELGRALQGTRPRVLVVDDTPAVAWVVARMLNSLGCNTSVAFNGQQAREMINGDAELNLVISDVVMPGESGVDLARAISRTHPRIRIALMSGYTQVDIHSHENLDALVFLPKPISRLTLKDLVEDLKC